MSPDPAFHWLGVERLVSRLNPESRWISGAPGRRKTPCPRDLHWQSPESDALRRDPATESANENGSRARRVLAEWGFGLSLIHI